MMNLLKYTLLIFLLSFAACNSEDDVASTVPNGQPQPGDALELTVSAVDFVTDGAPDTRATDNENETTFENGDRVGIIILDADNNPIYDNIPYKYDSSNKKWVFDDVDGKGGCYYDPESATYIVYYPYSRAADGLRRVDDLKTKFAPRFNQSEIKDYRASDLMIWSSNTHLPSSEKVLNAELEHVFASIVLAPTVNGVILDDGNETPYTGSYVSEVTDISNISDVSLTIDNTVYVPFRATDGTLRCIIPADITPSDIRCFYTIGDKTYGNTISISGTGKVAANTRYACQPEIKNVTYSLSNAHVGDFYCKKNEDEGYLIPGDVTTLIEGQKTACVGIVMKVGKDAADPWKDDCEYKLKDNITPMNIIHGYVLALYDANGGSTCQWGSYGTSVPTNTEQTTGFYGYKNTQAITSKGGDLSTAFPATYHATTGYDGEHPAPDNSSGWFLPSAGQCWYWLKNKDTISTSMTKAGGNGWSNYYWSSSENSFAPTYGAWCVSFYGGNVLNDFKNDNCYVRSCLAF